MPIAFQDILVLLEHRFQDDDDLDELMHSQNAPGPSSRGGGPQYPSVEEALEYLLNIAIEHFGYAAGDVYPGIYSFHVVCLRHQLGDISVAQLR